MLFFYDFVCLLLMPKICMPITAIRYYIKSNFYTVHISFFLLKKPFKSLIGNILNMKFR